MSQDPSSSSVGNTGPTCPVSGGSTVHVLVRDKNTTKYAATYPVLWIRIRKDLIKVTGSYRSRKGIRAYGIGP
jgi:hypothetical protein